MNENWLISDSHNNTAPHQWTLIEFLKTNSFSNFVAVTDFAQRIFQRGFPSLTLTAVIAGAELDIQIVQCLQQCANGDQRRLRNSYTISITNPTRHNWSNKDVCIVLRTTSRYFHSIWTNRHWINMPMFNQADFSVESATRKQKNSTPRKTKNWIWKWMNELTENESRRMKNTAE